jgi:hypothetical protein
MTILLKHDVNAHRRDYFIEKVNAPLLKAVTILGNRFPEPTMENVVHPNSKRLIKILAKYSMFEGNWRVKAVVMAVARVVISKLEHSPNWRDRISFFAEELRAGEWKPRSFNHPQFDWNEPKPYGGEK